MIKKLYLIVEIMYWHTDSSFKKVPSKISILSAREVPEEGGGTDFIDARHALETWENKPRKYSVDDLKRLYMRTFYCLFTPKIIQEIYLMINLSKICRLLNKD